MNNKSLNQDEMNVPQKEMSSAMVVTILVIGFVSGIIMCYGYFSGLWTFSPIYLLDLLLITGPVSTPLILLGMIETVFNIFSSKKRILQAMWLIPLGTAVFYLLGDLLMKLA